MADTRPHPPATGPPGAEGKGRELRPTEHGIQVHEVAATSPEREFTIAARTQTQMIVRRFLAHKLAVGSLVVFLIMVVAVSLAAASGSTATPTSPTSSPPHPPGPTRWAPTTSATTPWPRSCAGRRSRSRSR